MKRRPEMPRKRLGIFVFLLLLSVVGGLVVWNRPVNPLWVIDGDDGGGIRAFTAESSGGILDVQVDGRGLWIVAGESPTGDLACMESETVLVIRNLKTGAAQSIFTTPRVWRGSRTSTQDGKWVLLVTMRSELLVISLEDGSLRYPAIPIPNVGHPIVREDGRYAIIAGDEALPSRKDILIDLNAGKVLWSTKSRLSFCGTQDLVIAAYAPLFRIYRLVTISDERDVGSISFPKMKDRTLSSIHSLPNDRIALVYRSSLKNSTFSDTVSLSARVSDQQLVDVREEPLDYSRNEGGQFVNSTLAGQLRIQDLNESSTGRGLTSGHEFGSNVGLTSLHYSWQGTVSGHPVGPAITLIGPIANLSRDGQYLVESGQRLAVFPIPRRSRWPETMAVAALPWLLVAAWRTVRKRCTRSPSLAGSQPVQ